MSPHASDAGQTRKTLIFGGVALALIAIALAWVLRPGTRLDAPQDQLLNRMIAAKAEDRDSFVIELGNRGSQVIPLVLNAYKTAGNDAVLRVQLATVLYRTACPEAATALEQMLQEEKEPAARDQMEMFLAGLRRSLPGTTRPDR